MFHIERLRAVSPRRMFITLTAIAAAAGGGGLMLSTQSVSADRPAAQVSAARTDTPILLMTPMAMVPSPTATPSQGDRGSDKNKEHEACDAAEPAENHEDANDQDSNDRSGSDDVCTPRTAAADDHGDGANQDAGGDGSGGDGGSDN